jgi:hypothetical protein
MLWRRKLRARAAPLTKTKLREVLQKELNDVIAD